MANLHPDTPGSPDEDSQPDLRPSKSQVKRDMHALLDLGKELIALSDEQLRQFPISEKLYEAIRLAQRTTAREGRRRQTHYVGKLMRSADADAIRAQLDRLQYGSHEDTRKLHTLETLRDRLLDDDDALTKLLQTYPQADAQHLRSLIREGRKERQANKASLPGQEPQRKHYRALFQALKTLIDTE